MAIAFVLVSSLLAAAPDVDALPDDDAQTPPASSQSESEAPPAGAVDLGGLVGAVERSPGPANTDTRLTAIANRVWRGAGPVPEGFSPGSTLVGVELFPSPGTVAAFETYLAGAGATDVVRIGDMLSAKVPAALLEGLGTDPRVQWAQPASVPVAEVVTGGGVAAIDADLWQAAGWTGSGVKVAVIDLEFNGYTALLGNELPASVVTQNYNCGPGAFTAGPNRHGTAVAEIVHEVAPDASLYLICVDSLGDLSTAVTYAIANGVTVISHSVGWFNTGRGDGTGLLQPILENARNNEILWVNSAGNYAKQHWSGTFSDPDIDGWHEFSGGGDESNAVLVAPGGVVDVVMKWDDWPTSSVDYDLFLFDDSPTPVLLASSINLQTGTQPPEEALEWTNSGGSIATVHVAIFKVGAPPSTPSIDLFILGGSDIEYPVTARSLNDPATSPVVVAAGATHYATGVIEDFSSQGPTIDARIKPDLSAPDGVSGVTYGSSPPGFAGTSASAPHVAGAAALLSQAKPGITTTGLATLLVGHTIDAGAVGPDNSYGEGNLELQTPPGPDGLGLVDSGTADWHLRGGDGDPTVFNYGTAGYVPFVGDWDGDGIATPGMYRQSDGFVLLRNSNTAGSPDIAPFFLPAAGDTIPIVGDWDGDGDDTVSWYKPSLGQFNIINDLSSTVIDTFLFGAFPSSKPFAGDFNGNGSDTIGVHNGTTLSFRNSLSAGSTDITVLGVPSGDVVLTGDWDGDGTDTFGLYKPGSITVELHNSNVAGSPDQTFTWGEAAWLPVAGYFGPLSSGVTITWNSSTPSPPLGLEYAVESLYLEYPAAPTLPAGLRTNLNGLPAGPKTTFLPDLVYTRADAFGGFVSVVTAGADTILLASDDNVNWRVAGVHLSSQGKDRWFGGSPRFVAIIGADAATNPNPLYSAADALHIISMVPEDGAGVIVNIPRDTIVKTNYPWGWTAAELSASGVSPAAAAAIIAHCAGQCDKVNRTMMDKGGTVPKGPETTVIALELETGLDLEGYFHTGFAGFKGLVDAFRSAFTTVFSFTAPYDAGGSAVAEGQTTLTGSEALAFARERKTLRLGDYDRTQAQGLLLKAAIANVQPFKIQSTPGLLAILDDFVTSDLTLDQVLTFAASMFVVDTGPMPTLRNFHLTFSTFADALKGTLGSLAFGRNPGTIPNVLVAGCPSPIYFTDPTQVLFNDGSWSSWYVAQNWAAFADLADGTLDTTPPFACETSPGYAPATVWASRPLGFLRVTTSPAVSSQILIDGIPADTWGLTWLRVPRGTYTVSFRDLEGFTTPAPQTVTVVEGVTTPVVGSFTQRGNLKVTTSPPVPATISIDGIPRNDWGMFTDLPPGDYLVCFGDVADFTAPPCENANVAPGAETPVVGTYTPNLGAPAPSGHGFLRVTTSPAVPSQILIDGIPADTWGLTWLKVAPGAYTVSFRDLEGFATPAPQTVTVVEGVTTPVVGSFTQRGYLKVTTSPPVPATIFVDGDPRNDWGMFTDLPPGDYLVCFSDIAGLTTPACEGATVIAGVTTEIPGSFN